LVTVSKTLRPCGAARLRHEALKTPYPSGKQRGSDSLHGHHFMNIEKTQEQIERDRVEYALNNPWVLQYDFGHLELIKKYYKMSLT
jgi:hypothetical protein